MAREEHGAAYRERDDARQRVGSLKAKLRRERTQKLEAESVSVVLVADLSQAGQRCGA
jgi:hypothetical protein